MKAEWGFTLVFSLMILLMVTLLALGAINTSVLDIKIGSNDLTSKKAFYVEAPCRGGFRSGHGCERDGVADAWVPAGAVGTARLIAIRVRLSARPTHPDFANVLSRELESIATLRNRIL
jgi:hypothetical protein